MPLLSDLSEWRRRLDEIQQSVYTSTNDTDVVFIADFPGSPAVSININKWSNSFDERPHRRVVTPRDDEWIRSTFTPITSHGSFGINKWSNSFDERPHRRVVTPRGGEWIRPTLTALIRGSFGPHESAVKRHLDRFSCFCRVHTCVEIANLSPLAAANGFFRPRPIQYMVLRAHLSQPQTASRSVQPFLHSTPVCWSHRWTDRQATLRATYVPINGIHALRAYHAY